MKTINKKLLLEAFKKIILIRRVEEKISEEFKSNKIFSFLHLSIGQEATAVGVALATKKKDIFFGNHRSHGHYLAKDGNLEKMIFEVFGDTRGSCNGFGGSMHMIDQKVNFFASIPILGSTVPIASGISMAQKLKKEKNITVVFVGDGSAEEGAFYETVNLAGLYKLPIMIVIEDNRYAVEADYKKRKVKNYNFHNLFKKGLQAEYIRTDGNDFVKVFKSASSLRNKILKKQKVGILHLDCLRHSKHSGANININDQKSMYRFKNEHNEILKKDPLELIKKKLTKYNYDKKKINNLDDSLSLNIIKLFYQTFNKIKIRSLK
jgi:TPP-dependent pyruvate/acetoin dehydrogenase alpha subunit